MNPQWHVKSWACGVAASPADQTIRWCSHKREGQYIQRARSALNVTLASVNSSCDLFQRGLDADLTGNHDVTTLYLFAFRKTNGDCGFRHLMRYGLFFSRFYHLLLAFSNKRWPFPHSRSTTWCWPFLWRRRVLWSLLSKVKPGNTSDIIHITATTNLPKQTNKQKKTSDRTDSTS